MGKVPVITHYFPDEPGQLYLCQSDCFIGGGFTRNQSIDKWVQDVKQRGSRGAFNERSAKRIAKTLRK